MKKKKKSKPWTLQEIRVLLDHYQQRGPDYCAQVLQALGYDRSVVATNQKGIKIGLRYKGPRLGCFKKGSTPPNKGKKMTARQYKASSATMFKKGQECRNKLAIGTERYRKSHDYWFVKVAEPNKWMLKHRFLWEQKNGPTPPGHIVVFRDGNPHNFQESNLELISLKENVRRNRWGSGPSDYSLLSGRAARIRLNKRGVSDKIINQNPDLLAAAQAETLLKLKTRQRHANSQK